MFKAKIVRKDPEVLLPKYATPESAAFDLCTSESRIIKPNEIAVLETGLVIQGPSGYFLLVASRGSLSLKKGLRLGNSIGVIDRDYCGPNDTVKLLMHNITDHDVEVKKGERLAQGLFLPFEQVEWQEVTEIYPDSRGGGGSSGGYAN